MVLQQVSGICLLLSGDVWVVPIQPIVVHSASKSWKNISFQRISKSKRALTVAVSRVLHLMCPNQSVRAGAVATPWNEQPFRESSES